MRTFAYLRVSTKDQDNDKFRASVLDFAQSHGWPRPKFVSEKVSGTKPWKERRLGALVRSMRVGDKLIVPELSRLGRSLRDILDILQTTRADGIAIYAVKEGMVLNGSDNPMEKALVSLLGVFSELERDLISVRTAEGLAHAKQKGVRLGRPNRSRLDPHRAEIVRAFLAGTPIVRLAQEYNISACAMRGFLKKNRLVKG
jgi:DNA invertase Pin-like site-specific DNA recombinase